MRDAPTESAIQRGIMRWTWMFRFRFPEVRLLFAIPNGGWRHKATAGRMKAEGVKAGVPDLCLPVARGPFHGLWIEVKRGKAGKLSPHQEHWISELRRHGHRVEVVRSVNEAIEVITNYLS